MRLTWVAHHPSGTWVLRRDEVVIEAMYPQLVRCRFVDGFGAVSVPVTWLVDTETLEAAS